MKIPDRKKCFELLYEYKVPDNIIRHSLKNAQICIYLGRRLKEKGEEVNLELLYAAALLHDIGKLNSKATESHAETSAEILEKEGYPDLRGPVKKHVFEDILRGNINTWEEKLVFYADKIIKHDNLVTLKERYRDLEERYPHISKEMKEAQPLIEKLEKELLERAQINFETLRRNLDTYEITNPWR